jgi:hypothetical protein
MTFLRCLIGFIGAVFLVDCGSAVTEDKESSNGVSNECSIEQDCVEGRCVDGTCVAVSSVLGTVALEVIAPAAISSGEYQQMRYVQLVSVSNAGNYDVALDYVAELTVKSRPPKDTCSYSGLDLKGFLPISVEIMQDPRVNGIAAMSYVAASNLSEGDNRATVQLPPGLASIYIEPSVDSETVGDPIDDCTLVPLLALGQNISSGNGLFDQQMLVAKRLSIDVSVPLDGNGKSPLEDFVVDLVDPLLGRRLSTKVTLSQPVISEDIAKYAIEIAYQPVIGEGTSELLGRELFRITPPKSVVAPTYYVARYAVDLFGSNRLEVNHITNVPKEVTVKGQVETAEGSIPLASQVTAVLRNTSDFTTGAIAQFRTSTTSDEQGKFQLSLVAGEYDVVVTPKNDTLYASVNAQWTVASEPSVQAGKLVELSPTVKLSGRILGTTEKTGDWSANVLAIPSTVGPRYTFTDALVTGGTDIGRRSATGLVAVDGAFELSLDPGKYDVSLRPDEGNGYPWAVMPNTVVSVGGGGLGTIQISAPITFTGSVTVPGTSDSGDRIVLPGALIRVHALFDKNGRLVSDLGTATSAVQIGETRATTSGHYDLLLPASLE